MGYKKTVKDFLVSAELPRCEIYEMLCDIPDGDVYIYPTIEYDSLIRKDIYSFVFADEPVTTDEVKDLSKIRFYDLMRPCPPCDE